jgi:Ca2+-binding RTX toxin-like protein
LSSFEQRSFLRRATAGAITAAITTTAAVALAATPAHAAYMMDITIAGGKLTVTSSAGTADQVVMSHFFDNFIQIQNYSAHLTLASDVYCEQPHTTIVRCARSGIAKADVFLGDGNDTFQNSTPVPTMLSGGDGDDTLNGGSGADLIRGGAGKDTIHGAAGDDEIEGGTEQDKVYGDEGADILTSVFRDDEVFGGPDNDTLPSSIDVHGGPGNDRIVMTSNMGEYWGDEGEDTIDYSFWSWARVSLDGNDNDTGSELGDGRHNVHGDVDDIIGTPGNDVLTGHDSGNRIDAKGGDDHIFGKGGNDYLEAGLGNAQEIDGGTGHDTCFGQNVTVRRGCD